MYIYQFLAFMAPPLPTPWYGPPIEGYPVQEFPPKELWTEGSHLKELWRYSLLERLPWRESLESALFTQFDHVHKESALQKISYMNIFNKHMCMSVLYVAGLDSEFKT